MALLIELITRYGVAFLFVWVLVEQAGVPLPAYPLLLVGGSLAAAGQHSVLALLGTAVLACLVADSLWYLAGRRFGSRVLRVLCRLSLSADGCVRQTEGIFERWGAPSLLLAKFVPGFASVATAMAGATGIRKLPFLAYDAVGAALWAGVGLALGWIFAAAVEDVLAVLEQMGRWGLLLLAVLLAAFVATKAWRRYQFRAQLRMDRISVESLAQMFERGETPVVVDVRSPFGHSEGRIPGAILVNNDDWPAALAAPSDDAVVVVYCACPNEASAAVVAKKLMQRGFKKVRPLKGGIDAWRAAGLTLERDGSGLPA
ncbi:MAG TPA: DedA family protein/thiosulfate sulfurtransferase GlpE [Ideonella sp.]|nr:DedA family protein/thiosulfate sulfurtransferase GlpE [Ideonella sp.]